MSEGQTDRKERMAMAEQWRLLGEKLRRRSPHAFSKTIEMLTASASEEDEDLAPEIDGIYQVH